MNRLAALAAAAAGGCWLARALRTGYDFRGKTVILTGGSRGLGLVLARQLAERGARLAICARDPNELARAFEELAGRGGRVVAVECDITDRSRVREFVAVARQRLGPIDVLINNAGVIGVGPLETQTVEDFELSMRVHFWASLWTALEVIPEMKARGTGRIVNVSSFGGRVAVPHLIPYCAGKFALTGLSDGLRAELLRHGVVVTTVCPGLMRTGSHIQAELKGRHEDEYAWFALGNGIPGLSMSAERAARKILRGVALGDAEVVLTLPAKLAIVARTLFPNLFENFVALLNRVALPEPGGVGPLRIKGYASRGKLPAVFTTFNDAAIPPNNEAPTGPKLPAIPGP